MRDVLWQMILICSSERFYLKRMICDRTSLYWAKRARTFILIRARSDKQRFLDKFWHASLSVCAIILNKYMNCS